jgi:hypothetical protein
MFIAVLRVGGALPSDLSTCFHCLLPQCSGTLNAMNYHEDQIGKANGKPCKLQDVVVTILAFRLQFQAIKDAFQSLHAFDQDPFPCDTMLDPVPGFPNPPHHARPQIRMVFLFIHSIVAISESAVEFCLLTQSRMFKNVYLLQMK